MRRIEIAKILRNESDFLAKYFLSKLSEISNFNTNHPPTHWVSLILALYDLDLKSKVVSLDGKTLEISSDLDLISNSGHLTLFQPPGNLDE